VHLGKLELEERRRIDAKILDSSGDLNEMFDASKVLDRNKNTFWCSDPKNPIHTQWLSFDLGARWAVGKVKLLTPDNTSAPKEVLVESANRIIGPWLPVKLIALQQGSKKGREQSSEVPNTVARYWRLSVQKNYGNAQSVTIISVGFFSSREVTATVD
jgi:hypothetical protein